MKCTIVLIFGTSLLFIVNINIEEIDKQVFYLCILILRQEPLPNMIQVLTIAFDLDISKLTVYRRQLWPVIHD